MYKKIEEITGNPLIRDVNGTLFEHTPFETAGMKKAQESVKRQLVGKQ